MKLCRKLTAALLALAIALTLAGCGDEKSQGTFDAVAYMDGMLRATYMGEYSEGYLELVGQTQEEAEAIYENSVYLEAQVFAYLYSIEYPQDIYEELREMYRQIYSHAKFEVVSAVEEEDGSISVQVNIEPIDIVQKADAKLDEELKPFYEKYPAEVQNAMTTEEYEAFDAEWARLILDTYQETLDEIGNLEMKSVTVLLKKNEEGYYALSDDEFKKLNTFIIDYGGPEIQPDPTPVPTESLDPDQAPDPEGSAPMDPEETPGENDPVPPTTASPLPMPEESEESRESPEGTE